MSTLSAIGSAINELYASADVALPTADRCITPLGELVASFNLNCTELSPLSSDSATTFLLKQGGMAEPFKHANREPLAGFLYANSNFGSIFVERGDILVRRRFSVAHELGHYLLHIRPLLAIARSADAAEFIEVIEAFPYSPPELEPDDLPTGVLDFVGEAEPEQLLALMQPLEVGQWEPQANQFAVELLMPSPIVRELVARHAPQFQGEDLVWRMATEMLVSRAAMRWRLRDLGLLPPPNAEWN